MALGAAPPDDINILVTTPAGVMTDRKARASGVGGEVLCYVA